MDLREVSMQNRAALVGPKGGGDFVYILILLRLEPFFKFIPNLLRLHTLFPQLSQAQRIMPFSQPGVLFIAQQWTVKVSRHRISQRADQQQLSRGALEQVCTADDFSNLHGRIVHNHGQLISRDVIATPEQKVGEVASGDELLLAEVSVVK